MPIYSYRCTRGHQFDTIVKLDQSDAPTCCTVATPYDDPRSNEPVTCCAPIEKQLTLNAKSFPGADSWRK